MKTMLRKWNTCIRAQGKTYNNPIEAPLPEFRVEDVSTFTNVRIDHVRPLFLQGIKWLKCYIILCSCHLLHFKIVTFRFSENYLSVPVFLTSLRRLAAHRGTPSPVNTDSAHIFKFAAKFLDSLAKEPLVFSFK